MCLDSESVFAALARVHGILNEEKGRYILAKNPIEELIEARGRLIRFVEGFDLMPQTTEANELWNRANQIGKSSSGSWMGYHANVYYENFDAPPAGSHFDVERGTGGSYYSSPDPAWVEHTAQNVFDFIVGEQAKNVLASVEQQAELGAELLKSVQEDVASILAVYLSEHEDSFVRRVADEIEKIKITSAAEIANNMSPKGQVITQDMTALQQGIWLPPHVKIEVRVTAAHQPAANCRELAGKLEKLAAHLSRVNKREARAARVGTNVFIGHGRSPVWRDLKDFVQERLLLPYDEFNRVPVAGITNIARLSEMLEAAACAFVIMTAEDELEDGRLQARMNVIHEVGLFQGRLGFTKAIVLLEEGCEEFSNINGLGQIRFPKGNIGSKFEEIRHVLEREGVIEGAT